MTKFTLPTGCRLGEGYRAKSNGARSESRLTQASASFEAAPAGPNIPDCAVRKEYYHNFPDTAVDGRRSVKAKSLLSKTEEGYDRWCQKQSAG